MHACRPQTADRRHERGRGRGGLNHLLLLGGLNHLLLFEGGWNHLLFDLQPRVCPHAGREDEPLRGAVEAGALVHAMNHVLFLRELSVEYEVMLVHKGPTSERCERIADLSLFQQVVSGGTTRQLETMRAAATDQKRLFFGCDVWLTPSAMRARYQAVLWEEPRPEFYAGFGPFGRPASAINPRFIYQTLATPAFYGEATLTAADGMALLVWPDDSPERAACAAAEYGTLEMREAQGSCRQEYACETLLDHALRDAIPVPETPYTYAGDIEMCVVTAWRGLRARTFAHVPKLWVIVVFR